MSINTPLDSSNIEAKEVDYTKLIPFATAGLIFLGVSRLIFYYGFFGIQILSFLEFGEIITSFLDVIVFISFIAIGSLTQVVMVPKKKSDNETKPDEPKLIKSKWNVIFKITLFVAALVWIVNFLIIDILKQFRAFLAFGLIFCFTGALTYIFYAIYKKHPVKFIRQLSVLLIVLVASEMIVMAQSISDYRRVKYEHKYLQTKIIFKDDTIMKDGSHAFISDSSNFYIGKTNNYIFIHYSKENITSAFPISSVARIDVKMNSHKSWFIKLLD